MSEPRSAADEPTGRRRAPPIEPLPDGPGAAELAAAGLAPPRRTLATYSPFRLGLTAAIGFGLAYLLFRAVEQGKDSLLLLLLALFLAAGLDPAVRRVERFGLSRGLAVAVVFGGALLLIAGLGVAVVPPLVEQTSTFVHNLPGYVTELQHNRRIADLDRRFGVLNSVQNYLKDSSLLKQLAGNLLSVGSAVASTIFQVFTLFILTLYFLVYLDDITGFAYRLTPASRRPQVSRIGDKIVSQIGHYLVGTVALALLRGLCTLIVPVGARGALPVRAGLHRRRAGRRPAGRHGAGRHRGVHRGAAGVGADRHRGDLLLHRLRGAGPDWCSSPGCWTPRCGSARPPRWSARWPATPCSA